MESPNTKQNGEIEAQLAELLRTCAENEENQRNVDIAHRIADLCEQKGDLHSALEWYKYTSALLSNTDPGLTRKAFEVELKVIDASISEDEEWLREHSTSEKADEVRKDLDCLKDRKAHALIDETRKRVRRNPNDFLSHFELGEQLLAAGDPAAAIPELQQGRKNPKVHYKAMSLLGDCYDQKHMFDFAVHSYEDACKEMVKMDDLKKEVTYKLGLLYERMGNRQACLERLKEIYDVDYSYKDVAQRVEGSYAK